MIPDRVLTAVRARLTRGARATRSALAPDQCRWRGRRAGSTMRASPVCAPPATCSKRDGDALSLVAALHDEPARTGAFDRVVRSLAAEGLAHRVARRALRGRAPSSARPPGSSSSARPRVTSACAPTPSTSTASSAAPTGSRCGSRGAARRKRSIPRCSTISSAAVSRSGNRSRSTLVKEAWEEAGIPPGVASAAARAGEVHLCREVPDGLERETIFVHDVWLPADFVPACQDGEAVEHRLVSAGRGVRAHRERNGARRRHRRCKPRDRRLPAAPWRDRTPTRRTVPRSSACAVRQ